MSLVRTSRTIIRSKDWFSSENQGAFPTNPQEYKGVSGMHLMVVRLRALLS